MQLVTATTRQAVWRSGDATGATMSRGLPVVGMAQKCARSIGAAGAAAIGLEAPSKV
jgi:hypothetical protein